jgi:hypothetical protein
MAATPTRAESAAQVGAAVRLIDGGLTGIAALPADEEALNGILESDFAAEQSAGAAAFRAAMARGLAQAFQPLTPALQSFVKHQVGTPERDIQTVISRLYQDLIDNAETIQERNINYGAATPDGGNTGDGVITRLTLDEFANNLEATHLDVKTIIATADQSGGAIKHEETFRARGATANIDSIEVAGSGQSRADGDTRSKTSQDSQLANCGFESFALGSASFAAGVANLTSDSVVTSWELLDGAGSADATLYDLVQTTALQYRDLSGVTTPTSIRATANTRLRQSFSVNSVVLVFAVPYGIVIHVYRENLADGTLTVTWGGSTQAITVSTLTNNAWNKIIITADENLWPSVFNTSDPFFQLEWSGRTTGELIYDEVEGLIPMFRFDGLWHHISGGQTKWLERDEVTFTDALVGADSQLQQWLFRNYGRHLPSSAAPSANWVEPF